MSATDLATRLFDAIERNDIDTVRNSYHPDAEIWHNTDNVAKPRDHTMQLIGWLMENMPPLRYVDRHCSATEDGFVQRHTVIITTPDGREVNLPCCVVASVKDDQVYRLYEYYDSATQNQTGISV
jgi:ketosteroid isomerase-like protein